ncbi:hypothetical protein PAXRUDRAFT_31160 [Paxillus rubicundulus Ve08.2h10]|uniref:Uncharacterized protein n=1 Tax=Paxillus rubicundulus Ve08.2h10 TaxID=930991 RepID=A0A0D0EBZ5_9AGAM|nr:hypothetical protein PAXRUDRAFT_31160 [Paxillus rubicundulus Ve08.2h10]
MGSIYNTPRTHPGMLTNIPFDLIHEVAGYLDSKASVLQLALSSKHLFLSLCPSLYCNVQLDSAQQCVATLSMLNIRPDIARHVRKLVIRFSPSSAIHSEDLNGCTVSSLVKCLASKLDSLHTFIWDAEEIPQCDDMWFALRMSCPRLRTVGTAYGAELPKSHSSLFQFKGLRGFLLSLKRGFYERYLDSDLQELPSESRLWDMLINRSPDLEELQIAGASFTSMQPVHPLCQAHWPRLHTLSLGDILLDWQPRVGVKPPFIAFLEAHPHLRSLRTSRAALNPALLPSLEQGSLSQLTHFGGAIEHLQGLANIHSQITSVALDEPLIVRDFAPLLVAGVLQGLKFLTELRVCFVFHSIYDGGSLIRSIVSACPGLTTLEVVCVRGPSFTIEKLAKVICALPRLRHLRVTLVRSRHEEPLSTCAALIARSNPRLYTFSITFIPPELSLPLSLGVEIGRTSGDPGHHYAETGNYVLRTDGHGLPTAVTCTERRTSRSLFSWLPTFPIPLVVPIISFGSTPRTTSQGMMKYCYTLDLRPGTKKHNGLGLVLERSAAGEEVRVLIVLMSLTGLALWGFFA